jgi:N-acetylglucosaminyldiphosphoundecaprenol N-acetyl-beta-D-mannosaminyltransferase
MTMEALARRRVEVLGVPVDAIDMDEALRRADWMVQSGPMASCILAVNPEKVMSVPRDPWLWQFVRQANLLIPDGIGVVWAARFLRGAVSSRVPGADLMQKLCGLAERRGYPIFLYGAKEEVSEAAAARLQERFPGLKIAGRANGFVPAEEMNALVDRINSSGAKILFVALGSPRQERWIAEHRSRLQVKVIQGIGGTLDTIAGTVKRAPVAWQRLNLEWLYRLLSDPRRLARQVALPAFAWRVILDRVGLGAGREETRAVLRADARQRRLGESRRKDAVPLTGSAKMAGGERHGDDHHGISAGVLGGAGPHPSSP